MKIFSGSSNRPLAEKIASVLELPLSPIEIFIFPDGERRIQIQDNVVSEDTVVIQSTNTPVDTNYMELFLIMDGLKRSGARSVTVVMPYMGYQRQDHIFRDGEAVSIEVVVRMLEAQQMDKIIFFDPHTIKLPEFFRTPVINMSALPLFAKEVKKRGWDKDHTVLVSPDMGGLRRIQQMSGSLDDMPWIATVKDRDLNTGTIVIDKFEGPLAVSELKGKRALIVDDMISSGTTIIQCASFLKSNDVTEVDVFASHPILSSEAPILLQESGVDSVYVTDSVLIQEDKRFAKLEILTISDMIAGELKNKI
jgi:ribose-phosphate pyrophosphokinase